MKEKMKLIVNNDNVRLDKYVSDNSDLSRGAVNNLIKNNNLFVNETVQKRSYNVKKGDIITFVIKSDNHLKKYDLELDVVFEDEYLMVVNKPVGITTHINNLETEKTLVNALYNYTNKLSDLYGFERLGIVHRLDKDTSGLLIVAKTNEVHYKLTEMFKTNKIKREYLALVDGIFPTEKAKINMPIKRSKTRFDKQEVSKTGKTATTEIEVIKRFASNTLVKANLITGRTHQIRVHLSHIGFPVFNDSKYGTKKIEGISQILHAYKLEFIHPVTKKEIKLEKEMPKKFADVINALKGEEV